MKIVNVRTCDEMSRMAAETIAAEIKQNSASVLGLATGSSPVGTYKKLIEMNEKGETDFSRVVSFNLDEYCGLPRSSTQSYYYFMMDNLFDHINIDKKNVHLPNGMAPDFERECEEYEKQIETAGGIDLQLLGIGLNGHIGFNEPDTVFHNKTRRVPLTASTINANKRFFARSEDVPKTALSMGIGTIMAAKKVILLAGPEKKEIIDALRAETVSPHLPASILHYHPDCTVLFAEKN